MCYQLLGRVSEAKKYRLFSKLLVSQKYPS
jgi:hypothetical protein